MKKKWIAMGTGVGIGAVMLTVSAMSAMAGTSGYEAWKSALKQTRTAQSVAGTAAVTVSDNGSELFGASAAFKKGAGDSGASATVTLSAGAVTKGANLYLQDGKAIVKTSDSDVYRVAEHGGGKGPKWRHDGAREGGPDPEFAEGAERVLDALVGSLKDHVTLQSEADGGKRVSLHLTGSQVPVAVNAIGSLLVRGASDGPHGGWKHGVEGKGEGEAAEDFHALFASGLEHDWPKLTKDIRVDDIRLDATIDAANYFDRKSAEIRIVGKDDAGAEHSVVVRADIDLSGVNATTPDSVDLTGKQVEKIEHDAGWRDRGGRR
ncbi:hypothetical protein [Paenibacillus flagellatus]|uniref:DUF5666 domain-containing protein n=1 Tax=Paenibacillus flagellatus TaxID=2211139 RepID=A0A2V5KHQ5_9BACL|nr:hypothetical protein [Paenibacillus flagellatus]PYI53870.1 hypothetical protein DLM86_15045 [Paenibacillus flagellatus]